jgi:sRNA-binding carbon storage regulator CsrA
MLILTRRVGETLEVGNDVDVTDLGGGSDDQFRLLGFVHCTIRGSLG